MKKLILLLAVMPLMASANLVKNPDVSQGTIGKTICVPGYTKTVRPAVVYTDGVKRKLLRAANLPQSDASKYELDHVVPLTLGGHPRSLENLKLQLWPEAKEKDKLEVRLNRLVCKKQISLIEAQNCIYNDWKFCAKVHK